MEPVSKRKEMEVKSVWANGQDVIGPIEAVSIPHGRIAILENNAKGWKPSTHNWAGNC